MPRPKSDVDVEDLEPTLAVQVTLPQLTDEASSDDDDDIIVETLRVPVDVWGVPGLRSAIKETFEQSEALNQHHPSDFDVWYSNSEGRRTMVTGTTNVDDVLQATRVWLAPNAVSQPRPVRRRGSSVNESQPFRPQYETLHPKGSGTVKWMSTSLD